MIKPKPYQGQVLKGEVIVTRKIDGVRALFTGGKWLSRNGKPLYGLEHLPLYYKDCEVFLGSWEDTTSYIRSHRSEGLPLEFVYSLEPLDPRLLLVICDGIAPEQVNELMSQAKERGDEGLVLYNEDKAYKVKFEETYDVPVTGSTKGKGKYEGLVGALITPMGKVSGMTDQQRKDFLTALPKVIEVECMELTPAGKFRHPRLKRVRFDKDLYGTDNNPAS